MSQSLLKQDVCLEINLPRPSRCWLRVWKKLKHMPDVHVDRNAVDKSSYLQMRLHSLGWVLPTISEAGLSELSFWLPCLQFRDCSLDRFAGGWQPPPFQAV